MGQYMSAGFNEIDGIKATIPEGSFYFFADFNELADDLRKKGVSTSNDLGRSLIAHPHHIATVTGDACMLRPNDYGARIAFVDYDGKHAYENYREKTPKTASDEQEFVEQNALRMVKGIGALREYVKAIKE
ncbi:MAG TPA: hypothetical protein VMW67_04145 [Desulfobacteria bacterium]|nr:hypothetical protein [Desulfobacteria bacterium]